MHIIKVADIEIEVEPKTIKKLHLAVYPPDARVHISMPDYLADDDARNFVLQKLEWLRTQIEEVLAQPRQTKRQFVSGESHYLFGQRYQTSGASHCVRSVCRDAAKHAHANGLQACYQHDCSVAGRGLRHNTGKVI